MLCRLLLLSSRCRHDAATASGGSTFWIRAGVQSHRPAIAVVNFTIVFKLDDFFAGGALSSNVVVSHVIASVIGACCRSRRFRRRVSRDRMSLLAIAERRRMSIYGLAFHKKGIWWVVCCLLLP